MTEEQTRPGPVYTGMYQQRDVAGGYTLTVPTEWKKIPLKEGMVGMMFSPYLDEINTCVLSQKHTLKYKVKTGDLILLRDSFEQGVKDLPGVEVEKFDSSFSETINVFDAIFTFMDGNIRRKRWVRNIYWGEGQLVITAQGRTPEDYDYWLPMFYNIMTTCDVL